MADETPEPKPNEELTKISETLNGLSESLGTINTRIDSFETQLQSIVQPPAPETPAPAWQPQTWDDIPKLVEEKATEITQAQLNKVEQERQQALLEEQQSKEQIDKEFDTQLEALEKQGIIKPISNQNDPNDPGKADRRELFSLAAKLETLNLASAAEVLQTIHATGQTYDYQTGKFLRTNTTPAGLQVPVGSSSQTTGTNQTGPSYDQIHKARDMDSLIKLSGLG